ncbi:MAG: AsmA family protein, partial [Polaromonas sp.]|nr:AsmA family protein [Polaromonas sp.]
MNSIPSTRPRLRDALWARIAAVFLALVVFLVLLLVFFPWDVLRGPVNRYVSEQTGRKFEITRKLDVQLGRTTRVLADGIEFANPSWAREPYLVKAEAAEIQIRLWPLLGGRIELPLVSLQKPELGLQIEPDGRRTWSLAKDTADESKVPAIGRLLIDQGVLTYLASAAGADIRAEVGLAAEASSDMPLRYKAKGTWKGEPFTAQGRTGGVLQLSADTDGRFPMEIDAVAGRTRLKANGSVTNLAEFGGIDATFELEGRSLEDLYKLVGVVLPGTPPYKLRGQLNKQGQSWAVSQISGVLGKSDLTGALTFTNAKPVPMLTGKVQSRLLDFEDLGPIIGMSSDNVPAAMSKTGASGQKRPSRAGRVLPDAKLDFARLKAMDAKVSYSAAKIVHVKALPLDRMSADIKLDNGVLQLDPLKLGVAGGELAGRLAINGKVSPTVIETRLDARAIELNKLFPTIQTTKSSLGRISGQVDLKGSGSSTAQVLASSSGNVAFLMGSGQISNILLEYMGLDGGEIIKFLVRGDRNVRLRCAAAAFDVQKGLMTSKAIVLDTVDTVIVGAGTISLADETLNIRLEPSPKDASILSLR